MNEKSVNECLYCDCYDEDFGCTMPSMDKCYACPLEANDCGFGEQLCKVAVEALEKQIPKKPRKTTEDEEKNYYCSECKYYLGDEAEIQLCMPRPIYCPDCGQALDWSEEE